MSADEKIDVVALGNGVFTVFSGVSLFLMAGKVIDFGCVLREYSLTAELNSPVKCSFALRVQPFSKRTSCRQSHLVLS